MTLGDLEFKAEDFGHANAYNSQLIADRANALLRDRLGKQIEVKIDAEGDVWTKPDAPGPGPIRSARLVCIEETKP